MFYYFRSKHEAAARSLKAAGFAKLPNLAALQSEYEALQAQKEALYADYGKLKKNVREYDIIKQNIDSILQADSRNGKGKQNWNNFVELLHFEL